MSAHPSTHPVVAHKLTVARDAATSGAQFRCVVKELTTLLAYEATRSLTTTDRSVGAASGGNTVGSRVGETVAIVPILRSGLGMAEAMLELMPNAEVHHIGMFSSKVTSVPIQYYNRLPRDHAADVAYVLDPLVARGSTMLATVQQLKKWGAKRVVIITLVASAAGVAKLHEVYPDVEIHCAAVDEKVTEAGVVMPGLGDVGDRMYQTQASSSEPAAKKAKH